MESIQSGYRHPRERLLHIIILFLSQAEPKPTWRVIVDALKSPAVNPRVGRAVEEAHFPETAPEDGADHTGIDHRPTLVLLLQKGNEEEDLLIFYDLSSGSPSLCKEAL